MDEAAAGTDATTLFPGDGEMARMMRAVAWAETPLGPTSGWPQALRSAVSICLSSRFPMVVWWGPDLHVFYNDAYRPSLGAKHPAVAKPGREVWGEIWPDIGPQLQGVLESGIASWADDALLAMDRLGYPEMTYWTFSYSPLLDDDGRVAGIFTAVSETTEKVQSARRMQVLRDLGGLAGEGETTEEVAELVVRTLSDRPEAPFCEVHHDGPRTGLVASSLDRGALPHATRLRLDAAVRTAIGESAEVPLTGMATADAIALDPPWPTPLSEAVVLPLHSAAGEDVGALVVGVHPGGRPTEGHRAFLRLVAEQVERLLDAVRALEDERRRAAELAELDRAKTAFFNNVSHEFRTPLTLMLGPLAELRAADLPDAARGQVEVAERSALRLLRLVNTLLDFSRGEAGRTTATFVPLELGRATAELASVFRSACERVGLALEVDCPPLEQPVLVDPEQWETILLNLVSNAFKHTFEGSIAVRLRDLGEQVALEVADTGVGIPAAEVGRVFERFHQARGVRSRTHEGSGIGLALVQDLVRLHGGAIEVESEEGRGTTFRVRLRKGRAHLPAERIAEAPAPGRRAELAQAFLGELARWDAADVAAEAIEPAAPSADAAAAPAADGHATGPEGAAADGAAPPDREAEIVPTILVADDNADMREYVARLLAARWRVVTAPDGERALAAARRERPDLVLSDVMMPRLDGFGLLRAIRADRALAGTPVILLSARAGEDSAVEGLEAGADDYLVKPFTGQELLARVGANLELSRRRSAALAAEQRLRERLQSLYELGAALAGAQRSGDIARVVVQRLSAQLGARVTVLLPDDRVGAPLDEADARAARAAAAPAWREPLRVVAPPDGDATGARPLSGTGARGAVPLLHAGRRVGTIVAARTGAAFSAPDRAYLLTAGRLAADALTRARAYETEHDTAVTLQRSLLGGAPRARDERLAVSGRYLPASTALEVGGDWYDCVERPDGTVVVCVGDVVGSGVRAAAAMGQLRSAFAALALGGSGPRALVERLDAFADRVEGAGFATFACAELDPATLELRYSCAGHPPPVLIPPTGAPRLLLGGRSTPLSVMGDRPEHEEASLHLAPGSTLVLYTDGLVERRGVSIDEGLDELVASAAAHRDAPLGQLLDAVVGDLFAGRAQRDDTALLGLRAVGAPRASFVRDLPADRTALSPLRADLRAWLGEADVPEELRYDVLLACGEACANAICHAYADREEPGPLHVSLHRTAEGLVMTVADEGAWNDGPGDPYGGRGLAIMRAVGDLRVSREDPGTVVTLKVEDRARAEASGEARR